MTTRLVSRLGIFVVALLVMPMPFGCRRAARVNEKPTTGAAEVTDATEESEKGSARLSSNDSTWRSESFSAAAGQQLDDIFGTALSNSELPLNDYVNGDFRPKAAFPSDTPNYADGKTQVFRNRIDPQSGAVDEFSSGVEGLRELLVSAGGRVAYQSKFSPGANQTQRSQLQRLARGNSLFIQAGTLGGFRDVSLFAGVNMARWAWSSCFADVNNDGFQDIVVANGNFTGEDSDDL